jgi:hypothetical protein
MPVKLQGAVELRKALKKFEPVLAKETQKEMAGLLRVITSRAKGYVPAEAPLSGWSHPVGIWGTRAYDSGEIKRGLTYSTTPSKPNKRGFRSLATIFNKSAAGAIYETAGRKSPNGQPPQASTKGKYSSYKDTSNKVNKSANPHAGQQFIDSMGEIYKAQRVQGQGGRVSRKMNGRLIFRAWGEDQGKTNAAIVKAIEKSMSKVLMGTKGAKIMYKGR